MSYSFEVSSQLKASPEKVWQHATNMSAINQELAPFLKMTYPKEAMKTSIEEAPLGTRLFRSWILLGGLIPVDYDDVTLREIDRGKRFLEISPMLTQQEWSHERIVKSWGEGTEVIDRVKFTPRLWFIGKIYHFFSYRVFLWRHYRLRKIFGEK